MTQYPETEHLRVQVDGAVGGIVLARPAKLNALNRGLLEELAETAAWFDEQADVKVVVVSGEGTSFSAGFDLNDPSWRELGPPEQSAAVLHASDAQALVGTMTGPPQLGSTGPSTHLPFIPQSALRQHCPCGMEQVVASGTFTAQTR